MSSVSPVPKGFNTVSPHLIVRNAKAAINYYKDIFKAELIDSSQTPDGEKVMNATLKIGDSYLMIADELSMMEYWVSPSKLQGTTVGMHLYVEDVDEWFKRAKNAGVEVKMELMDTFWGDRYCQFYDKFGHAWSIATRIEDLTQEEINNRAKEWFKQFEK